MAKSIRSKWRQKMRNEKRQKNRHKELDRLKRIAAIELENRKQNDDGHHDGAQSAINADLISQGDVDAVSNQEVTPMAVDSPSSTSKKYNKRTMLDENGQYPVWMSKRQIQKLKKKSSKKGSKKKRL